MNLKVFTGLALIFLLPVCSNGHQIAKECGANGTVTYLGETGGKAYFASAKLMTWTEAKSLCNGCGLEHATILNQTQSDFVRRSLDINFPSMEEYRFWVSARDAYNLVSLVWDGTNVTPNANLFDKYYHWGTGYAYTHCMYVWGDRIKFHLYADKCYKPRGALCQL